MSNQLSMLNDDDEFDQCEGRALINAVQLAKLLSISERTLYRLKAGGHLPPTVNLGGSVRWRVTDIRRWIDGGCKSPKVSKFESTPGMGTLA
jgi:prophage regulatory protein